MPKDDIKAYVEASDNASDFADTRIDALEQKAREDIDDLYRNETNRDVELWEAFEVDPELVLNDYDAEEIRGLDWSLGLAGISAAAGAQFFLDNREETIIKPAAYREQALAGFALTRTQLVRAGKRGFELEAVSRYAQLRAEYLEKFAFMREVSNAELYEVLHSYGAIQSTEQAIVGAQKYVSRLTAYKPGSPQFKEEVSKLIDVSSKRGLREANRRAIAQINTVQQIGGDVKKPLVWIVEGGPNTCSYCASNAGEVDTYEGWEARGLPGAETCLGGDSCRCMLSSWY